MKRVYLLALILLVLTACRKEANAVPSSISFTPASVTVSEGRTFSLNIRAKYGDSFKTYDLRANTASLRFTSSRENVATVSASGEVTAKSSGQTIIEAASPDGKLQAKCTVNVSAEAVDYTKPFSTEYIYLKDIQFPDANGTADGTINGALQNMDADLSGNIYAIAVSDPVTFVKKISPDGKEETPMELYYFGHGTGFSIEDTGDEVYLWISSFGTLGEIYGVGGKYQSEQVISRIRYEAGKKYTPDQVSEHYYIGPYLHTWPSVDYEHSLLAVYHADYSIRGKDGKIHVFDLQEARNAPTKKVTLKEITRGGESAGPLKQKETVSPVITVKDLTQVKERYVLSTSYEELSGETQQMQGYCLYKDRIFWVSGRGYGTEKQPLAQVSVLDLNGTVLKKAEDLHFEDNKQDLINAGISADGTFEAEGMKIRSGHAYFGFNWNSNPGKTFTAHGTIIRF